jgi:regulation of enolase protein 1 (concanavalin A-like superfamily)
MPSSHVPFDSDRWTTKEPSTAASVDASPSKIVIESGPRTDWWRTATGSEPESAVNRASGPLYYLEVPNDRSHWKAGAWIAGCFDERFKQATLFIGREGYAHQGNWVKAGIEVEDGQHNVG